MTIVGASNMAGESNSLIALRCFWCMVNEIRVVDHGSSINGIYHLVHTKFTPFKATCSALVAEREGYAAEDQVILCNGKPLDAGLLTGLCSDMATLDVQIRMLGGKVHGSLARAGKVKGQCPKVDKQEKKKGKTGRAKRRMQYNRRFVNVVQGFGRRKGPNSNS